MSRSTAISMVTTLFLIGLLLVWILLIFVAPILQGSSQTGVSVTEFFGLEEPDFTETLTSNFARGLNPLFAFRVGGIGIWFAILLSITFVVSWRNSKARDLLADYGLAVPFALLPFFVTAFRWPLEMKHGFRVLAKNGLTDPAIVTALLGEALITPFWGLVLSAILVVLSTWLLNRNCGLDA